MTRKYDSTVARIAGNILSGFGHKQDDQTRDDLAKWAVSLARAIVAEVERTELLNENATSSPSGDSPR